MSTVEKTLDLARSTLAEDLCHCLDMIYAIDETGGELHAMGVRKIRQVLERCLEVQQLEVAG